MFACILKSVAAFLTGIAVLVGIWHIGQMIVRMELNELLSAIVLIFAALVVGFCVVSVEWWLEELL